MLPGLTESSHGFKYFFFNFGAAFNIINLVGYRFLWLKRESCHRYETENIDRSIIVFNIKESLSILYR